MFRWQAMGALEEKRVDLVHGKARAQNDVEARIACRVLVHSVLSVGSPKESVSPLFTEQLASSAKDGAAWKEGLFSERGMRVLHLKWHVVWWEAVLGAFIREIVHQVQCRVAHANNECSSSLHREDESLAALFQYQRHQPLPHAPFQMQFLAINNNVTLKIW